MHVFKIFSLFRPSTCTWFVFPLILPLACTWSMFPLLKAPRAVYIDSADSALPPIFHPSAWLMLPMKAPCPHFPMAAISTDAAWSDAAWSTHPPMNNPRAFFGAAPVSTDNGKKALIVAGGWDTIGMDSAEMFDPETQEWKKLPSMSTERYACEAVGIGSQFFVMGGWQVMGGWKGNYRLSDMEMFDLETQKWVNLPDMNIGRFSFAAAAVGHSIFVFGGFEVDTAEKYDISEQKWMLIPSMPTPRCGCAAAAIGNKIYVVGGYDENCTLRTVECYDVDSKEWRTITPMNRSRDKCAVASSGKHLFVMGGCELDSVEVLDVETETWTMLPNMSVKRYGCGAAIMENSLFVVGGSNDGGFLASMEELSLEKESPLISSPSESLNNESSLQELVMVLEDTIGQLKARVSEMEVELFGKTQEGNLQGHMSILKHLLSEY